jgi:hypothetical protein
MIFDQLPSRTASSARSPSANGLSRRKFLEVGAAAGGGLMLSLSCRSQTAKPKRPTLMASRPMLSSALKATGRLS